MGKRRRGRECAIQCLYQWEMTGAPMEEIVAGYLESRPVAVEVGAFCERLVDGVVSQVAEIDELLAAQAEHWRPDRIGKVERGILRLGVYELVFERETPAAVAIDEAIELAKRYCGPKAAQFVNGILDGIRARLAEEDGEPAAPSPI